MKKFGLFAKSFAQKFKRDKIYNYAATSAFFIILSIFPFLILLITLIQYTPITEEFLVGLIDGFIPDPMYTILVSILDEIFNTTAGAGVVFIAALCAIWASSRGILGMIRGLDVCFNIEEKRNYIHLRLLSCGYTILMIVVMVFALILMLFGSALYNLIGEYSTGAYNFLTFILKNRIVISVILLTILFTIMYCLLPAKKNKVYYMLPGALGAAIAWVILTYILSVFFSHSTNFSYIYGSLTSLIIVMLWLYFGMFIIFIAAEANQFFRIWMRKHEIKKKRKKAIKYDERMALKKEKADNKRRQKELKALSRQKKAEEKQEKKNKA